MPSIIGHGLWGLATGAGLRRKPFPWRLLGLGLACSVAADFDSLGFRLGIPYEHWLGHRGLLHGILFAVLLALGAAALMPRDAAHPRRRIGHFAFFLFCGLSHIALDACSTGGLGVAFFAPFSNRRYFLPWRFLDAVPIGINQMLSTRWFAVIARELRILAWPMIGIFLAITGTRLAFRNR